MLIHRFLLFVIASILAGLIAGYVALQFGNQDQSVRIREATNRPRAADITPPFSYAAAVRAAAPSVVNIYTAKITTQRENPLLKDPYLRRYYGSRLGQPRKHIETSLGSGVIISANGLILTNHHVIQEADAIKVFLNNGRSLDARVLGADSDADIAVLKVDATDLPTIPVAHSADVRVGDVALAIGNPFGVGQTVTMGIISATGRNHLGINTFENFIQTDAAINPGNSGGALVDARGNLIGINTAIFSKSGGYQGIGFTIPSDLAIGVMKQIIKHGRVIRGWLGVAGEDVTPALARAFGLKTVKGVLISAVLRDGPADQAGVRPGDVITEINGRELKNAYDILNIVSVLRPGSKVSLDGLRGSTPFSAEVVLAERPRTTEPDKE